MPRAVECSSRPSLPSRLATRDGGSRAKSPTEWTPQRSRVAARSTSGLSRWRGSGARKGASSPAGTTTGGWGRPEATRAASLLEAIPTRAGIPAASAAFISSRPISSSGEGTG